MIEVEEAKKLVLDHCILSGTETIDLNQSDYRILAEDINADRDFPPFDRITMDGIAIEYKSFKMGIIDFPIQEIIPAGTPKKRLLHSNNCFEVMTGASMPNGVDTVIPYEMIQVKDGIAKIETDNVRKGQNVHLQGFDRKQGDLLIPKGTQIGPAEKGILATVGKKEVQVLKTPRIAIISSGDELVPVDETPLAHQIRRSNAYTIEAALKRYQAKIDQFHFIDELGDIENKLKDILNKYDLLIISGGVSKGKFDFIPEALSNLGVKKLFHRVKQRPGKPFWFGIHGDKAVFALPGNPVSSFMCTMNYVVSWLDKNLGQRENPVFAKLSKDIEFKPDLQYYAQVQLKSDLDGSLMAIPIEGHGSGDLANLGNVNAFIEIPRGKTLFEKGEVYKVLPFLPFI